MNRLVRAAALLSALISLASPARTAFATGVAPLVPIRFSFPRDDGAHARYRREMWRAFGFLKTQDGRTIDVTADFFRFSARPNASRENASAWSIPQFYSAAFAIEDRAAFRYLSRTRMERATLGLASARDDRLAVRAGAWSLEGTAQRDWRARTYALRAERDGLGLALDLRPERRPVPLGPGGIERTGACESCESYGYAITRSRARGTIEIDGRTLAVTGSMWLDHQFGDTLLAPSETGTVRVAVQFVDGRDLLIDAAHGPDGKPHVTSATFVRADGTVKYYGPEAIALLGGRFATGSDGTLFPPARADLEFPAEGLEVSVETKPGDAIVTAPPGGPPFLEGGADVGRFNPPDGDHGRGFLEVTGFDRKLDL